MNTLKATKILILYALQEGITVVKTTANQCICLGDGDRFWKKFVHAAKDANLSVARFLYITDLVSKGESSIKNYTQIANLVYGCEVVSKDVCRK